MLRNLAAARGAAMALLLMAGCAQKNAEVPVAEESPTDKESRQFAKSFEEIVRSGNIAAMNEAIDWDAVLERVVAGSEGTLGFREGFKAGAKRSFGSPTGFAAQVMGQVKIGGEYRLLRVHAVGEQQRALYRLNLPNGGLNYHDLVLVRKPSGKVLASDVFVYMTGEMLSQTMRRTYLPLAADQSKSMLARLTRQESEFVKSFKKQQEMSADLQAGRHREAMEVYSQLPESVQKDKNVLMYRLRAAEGLGEREYEKALRAYRTTLPDDPCLDFLSLDYYFLRRQYDKLRAALDRLEKSLGGDPYLDVFRANSFLMEKKYAYAKEAAQRALAAEDTLLPAYWNLVSVSLAEKDFDETSRLLGVLGERFKIQLRDLVEIPEYAEYAKSPQYQAWQEKSKQK